MIKRKDDQDNPGVICAHLPAWEKNLLELNWLVCFFLKNLFLGCVILTLTSFTCFWEAKGQNIGYFLTLSPSYTEESGDTGRTRALPSPLSTHSQCLAPLSGSSCRKCFPNRRAIVVSLRRANKPWGSEAQFTSDSYLHLMQASRISVSIFLTFPAFLQINNIMHQGKKSLMRN